MDVSTGRQGILWTPQDSALPKNFVESGFTLSAGTGLQVEIAAGRCDINGKLFYTTVPLYCDVPASSSTKIYLNYSAASFTPVVSTGSGDLCLGTVISGSSSITAVSNTGRKTLGGTLFTPCMPIGMPFPCLTETRPDGTLLCDGSSFDVNLYPDLAKVYPSGILPDLRGVTLRGLDRGRGLDIDGAARALGNYQADSIGPHTHSIPTYNGTSGNWGTVQAAGTSGTFATNSSTSANGGTETRMKNVAVDWLVYATLPVYDLSVNNANAATFGGYAPAHFLAEADLKTRMNAAGDAPMYTCRAWANFNGTGTPAVIGSGNISSITDIGVGQYQLNFSTPLPDANYTPLVCSKGSTDANALLNAGFPVSSSACKINILGLSAGNPVSYDSSNIFVAIFR